MMPIKSMKFAELPFDSAPAAHGKLLIMTKNLYLLNACAVKKDIPGAVERMGRIALADAEIDAIERFGYLEDGNYDVDIEPTLIMIKNKLNECKDDSAQLKVVVVLSLSFTRALGDAADKVGEIYRKSKSSQGDSNE